MNVENGRLWRVWLAVTLLVVLASWAGGWYYRRMVYTSYDNLSADTVSFVIEPGEKAVDIAQRLQDQGLIHSAFWFRFYLKLIGTKGTTLQAGEYELVPPLTIAEAAEALRHGSFVVRLTFIEGWRREEYAQYLAKKFSPEFAASFLAETADLEGYLFPDTYLVGKDAASAQLVSLLRATFEKKVAGDLRAGFGRQGLTLNKALIVASIVEREAKLDKDRPLVAGILIKRLENGWPLEADATVQYALANRNCGSPVTSDQLLVANSCDWWPQEIYQKDLDIDSPYNTRKNIGLPPGPISNPGLASIRAVAEPQKSDYWYYLSDSKGQMHYARTLEEHNLNVQRYLR